MIEKLLQLLISQANTISVVVVLTMVVIYLYRELRTTRQAMSTMNDRLVDIVQHNTKAMVELQQVIKRMMDRVR